MLTEQYQNQTAQAKRKEAWVQAGTAVNATSAADAASQAGLDWTVSLHDMFATYPISTVTTSGVITNNHMIDVVNRKAVIKTTPDGKTSNIGVVGTSYKVIQNSEIFGVLDTLIDSSELRYTAAGELNGGSKVWMVMSLPMSVQVANDPHEAFLIATTGHDGSQSFTLRPLLKRMFCVNQINLSMLDGKDGRRSKNYTYRLAHTKHSKMNISEIRDVIQLCYTGIETYQNISSELLEVQATRNKAVSFFEKVFPLTPEIAKTSPTEWTPAQRRWYNKTMETRDQVLAIYENSPTQQNIAGTAWGLFQSVVEYADHVRGTDADKRAIAALTGSSDGLKARALQHSRMLTTV